MHELLVRYLRFGTESRPPGEHRRIMALNLVVGMTILTGMSYGLFCVVYDFAGPYTIGEDNMAFGKPTRPGT